MTNLICSILILNILGITALRFPIYPLRYRNNIIQSHKSAIKTDLFGDTDNEEIEKLRVEKIIENDRWQSCNFRDFQGGEWAG